MKHTSLRIVAQVLEFLPVCLLHATLHGRSLSRWTAGGKPHISPQVGFLEQHFIAFVTATAHSDFPSAPDRAIFDINCAVQPEHSVCLNTPSVIPLYITQLSKSTLYQLELESEQVLCMCLAEKRQYRIQKPEQFTNHYPRNPVQKLDRYLKKCWRKVQVERPEVCADQFQLASQARCISAELAFDA